MITVGVMTGNSLDAVDAVLTEFDGGRIRDLNAVTVPYPRRLRDEFLILRRQIAEHEGDVAFLHGNDFFIGVSNEYTRLVARAVNSLCAGLSFPKSDIAAIGWHGQTLDHFPPSVAGNRAPYTLQTADAEQLAALTGLPVIYDFRSDDILNGGEGAPLAPAHNRHIAADLRAKGVFPVAFCNAGNTGNIAVVSRFEDGSDATIGWDAGPFNHFADMLARQNTRDACDIDGKHGAKGRVVPELLEKLFVSVARTADGDNFLEKHPPKSSDPARYAKDLNGFCAEYGFENTLRTVEYLAAYAFFATLSFIPETVEFPKAFLLFGGGWKNPLCLSDFKGLFDGRGVVLPRHAAAFAKTRDRLAAPPAIGISARYGYDGTYMEARIFADMARCRITGEPFSFPQSTGAKSPTVAGVYVLPPDVKDCLLLKLFNRFGTKDLIPNPARPAVFSRAAKDSRRQAIS